jgi:hypothetical protein
MLTPPFIASEIHVPKHTLRADIDLNTLKTKVDECNLSDMWDMILMLDYRVANVRDLNSKTQEEFCGIISLLLKAFST